jgi:hypothetical protein
MTYINLIHTQMISTVHVDRDASTWSPRRPTQVDYQTEVRTGVLVYPSAVLGHQVYATS